jgi:transposase InsO family protein
MSLRLEFVTVASHEDANIRALCRRYGISSRTAYKWLARYREQGPAGLDDQSRRPATSPGQTPAAMTQLIVETRQAHLMWGGRKIKAYLERAGHLHVPAASTVTAILRRQGQIAAAESAKHRAWQRFERAAPNELWQMDFKGPFALANGETCHPLTVLDDHSRFLVGLRACANQQQVTVQSQLTLVFQDYGLPGAMLMDNGTTWASVETEHRLTALTAWLMRLGIGIVHGRPAHPQTQGKDERLHRTLKSELLTHQPFADWPTCQQQFDAWRQSYNCERPHEALTLGVPADHYQASSRPFPAQLPPIVYGPGDGIRKVQKGGRIDFRSQTVKVGKAFVGQPVAVRATDQDGSYAVYFCQCQIATFNLVQA